MKVFIAALGTETNTFSPMPTGEQTFAETLLHRGDATQHPPGLFSEPLHVWRRMTEERQGQIVESLAAFAAPAGKTLQTVYEGLRDEILSDLERAMPVDVVLLNMHGAMVSQGCDDCEGDLLARTRKLVGPGAIIGGELDLHCHITDTMTTAADVLITYKEYPHVDAADRASELFEICAQAAAGRCKPAMSVYDCRMVSMWRTPVEPTKSFVARMQALEGPDGVLSVSFGHGFPWGDVADVGAKVLVVTDGDGDKGTALAAQLGREIWNMRFDADGETLDIDTALERALAHPQGPVVLADIADNAGGGAPSDSTFLLRRILERGIGNVASGLYWDPVAVRFCLEAGPGASFDLRLGGKVGPASGEPLDLRVRVMAVAANLAQTFGTSTNNVGDAAWVRVGDDTDIVINSVRTQVFHPDAFTQLGVELTTKKIVVVKSTQHFYAGYAPLAAQVLYVNAPGAIPKDFAAIPYTKRTTPYWPKIEDPW
ncbi:MAG: M81 family metallopeptidase [Gammaproteobacteria bacterium]